MKKRLTLFLVLLFFISAKFSFSQKSNSFIVVYNNIPSKNYLRTNWGYSVWIEKEDVVILFDTGTKATLLQENLMKLNLDPSKIASIVISHQHKDHTGGLEMVLKEVKKGTKVYLPNDFKSSLKTEFSSVKFKVNTKYHKIADGVWLTEVFMNQDNGIREQALIIEKEDRLIMLTGCAHPGIAEMCESVRNHFPDKKMQLVSGGFHIMHKSENEVIQISDKIRKLGFEKIAPSHCTGDKSIEVLRKEWGEDFIPLNLGDSYFF
ncbi:MBL fold metallo-hydrolase [Prolixibacteraceae bacterium Z1-6]|uniref:MBL fold metallo-hydrolase n=1 Tax=Draconibacterium aestuarii TaxID=2998507 RepID=A0A9X3J9A2_9BACT|nr:MBL fold metallo-hydrolase [Prolixibacteraceae bacterium Z1-6]